MLWYLVDLSVRLRTTDLGPPTSTANTVPIWSVSRMRGSTGLVAARLILVVTVRSVRNVLGRRYSSVCQASMLEPCCCRSALGNPISDDERIIFHRC